MRVISGKYKGKKLEGFDILGTRPTMDRVKESLFAMIQNEVKDSTILDLFAGSGALGIEALSMGAKEAYFVDSGKKIFSILKKNTTGMENAYLYPMDYEKAIDQWKKNLKKFQIVFLDPPYHQSLLTPTLKKLPPILEKGALIVCEYEEEKLEVGEEFQLYKQKEYGDKSIAIYKYLG